MSSAVRSEALLNRIRNIYIIDNKTKTTISEPMNDHNTVFQAEVTAIYKAANILNERNTVNKKITIYTNSTSAINAFSKKQSITTQFNNALKNSTNSQQQMKYQ